MIRIANKYLSHPRFKAIRNSVTLRYVSSQIGRLAASRRSKVPNSNNINTKEYWNNIWINEGLHARGDDLLHDAIIDLVPYGAKIIDIGCGNGQLIRKLIARRDGICTAMDMSDIVLDMLGKEFNIETIEAILPHMPCPEEFFDVAICSECLEHLDNPDDTVKQMHRIVREGGRLVITVPDGTLWKRGGEHVQEFTATDCINMLRPFVARAHLFTLTDHLGYPYYVVWGERTGRPIPIAKQFIATTT